MVIGGENSSLLDVTSGIPQGSILGPLLFILYVNDIVTKLNINVWLYADDVTIFLSYEDPEAAVGKMEDNLRIAKEWADNWFVN